MFVSTAFVGQQDETAKPVRVAKAKPAARADDDDDEEESDDIADQLEEDSVDEDQADRYSADDDDESADLDGFVVADDDDVHLFVLLLSFICFFLCLPARMWKTKWRHRPKKLER